MIETHPTKASPTAPTDRYLLRLALGIGDSADGEAIEHLFALQAIHDDLDDLADHSDIQGTDAGSRVIRLTWRLEAVMALYRQLVDGGGA